MAAHTVGRQGRQTRRGQVLCNVPRRREPLCGGRGLQPPDGQIRNHRQGRAQDRADRLDDDGLPGHGTGGRLHQGARSHHALRYGRADAAAARRRRAESRIPGQTLKQRSEKIGNRGRFK